MNAMFSLVTALVSPCVVDCLAHKKEALVAALQENASVVCSHPADSVCLLQGEWDNVKKAYAIVEEFYLRTQAETVVRRMLKVEPTDGQPEYSSGTCGGGLVGGRIPPDQVLSLLLSPPPTDEGEQAVSRVDYHRSPFNKSLSSARSCSPSETQARQHRLGLYQPSSAAATTSNGLDATSDLNIGIGSLMHATVDMINRMGRLQDDSSPPVLSREGNIDDMSDISDTSGDDEELCMNSRPQRLPSSVADSAAAILPSTSTLMIASSKDCMGGNTAPEISTSGRGMMTGLPAGAINNLVAPATVESEMDRVETVSSSRRLSSMSSDRSPVFGSSDAYGRPTSQQQPQSVEVNGSGGRLPQIASLFNNSALSAWPYAELYSAHLSAMRSICEATVKREASVDGVGDFSDHRSSTGGYRPEDDPLAPEMRCSRCDKTYRSEARMREHARTHDAGYVAVLHACPKCGKAFTYRHNMVVHLRRFHYGWQPAKRHACRTCGMRFQKPYLLRLHERKAHMPVQMESSQLNYGAA